MFFLFLTIKCRPQSYDSRCTAWTIAISEHVQKIKKNENKLQTNE
jgi:hypothetical protein